uniref:Uncharacterized protein n=1 Tax=Plectus sambesii TaxID=2011161 RepID=A0A914WVQ8_9BILA
MADQTVTNGEVNNAVQDEVKGDGIIEEGKTAVNEQQQQTNDEPSSSHAADGALANEEGADGDDDAVVTLDDVVDEQERMKADADALFNGQDHTVCTYPEVCFFVLIFALSL